MFVTLGLWFVFGLSFCTVTFYVSLKSRLRRKALLSIFIGTRDSEVNENGEEKHRDAYLNGHGFNCVYI